MAWSVTMTVTADGQVTVTATDCLGGCSYRIATKHGGDNGADVTNDEADARVTRGLKVEDSPVLQGWKDNENLLRVAAKALLFCLPNGDVFDDDGRPR